MPEMFATAGVLEVRVNALRAQVLALEKVRDEQSELIGQMESVRKSNVFRFTRKLSRLYHGMFGQPAAGSGPAADFAGLRHCNIDCVQPPYPRNDVENAAAGVAAVSCGLNRH